MVIKARYDYIVIKQFTCKDESKIIYVTSLADDKYFLIFVNIALGRFIALYFHCIFVIAHHNIIILYYVSTSHYITLSRATINCVFLAIAIHDDYFVAGIIHIMMHDTYLYFTNYMLSRVLSSTLTMFVVV